MKRVHSKARPNSTLVGYQAFEVIRSQLQHPKAFIFAAEEYFGILPVEVHAFGIPVIALLWSRWWGAGFFRNVAINPPAGAD